jgi:hypothetical protein
MGTRRSGARQYRKGAQLQLFGQPGVTKVVRASAEESPSKEARRAECNDRHPCGCHLLQVLRARDVEIRPSIPLRRGGEVLRQRKMKRASPEGSPHSFEYNGVESDQLHGKSCVREYPFGEYAVRGYPFGVNAVTFSLYLQSAPSWP